MIVANIEGYPTTVEPVKIYEITTGQPLTLAEALARSKVVPMPSLELIDGLPE